MSVKYLLDENMEPYYRQHLSRREPQLIVWEIGDPGVPPKSTKDPAILLWCEANDFVLVTQNRASMPVHLTDHLAQGRHIPGIIVLNTHLPVGETVQQLILLACASFADEFRDQIIHLPYA